MGLIKALLNATGGALADQYKEYIYCDSLPQNVLMRKGQKQQTGRGTNKGEPDIITNGSVMVVNEGQCMVVVEDGKVTEITCEPGRFTYDNASEPSVFAGNFGESLLDTFKTIGKRVTFGGTTGHSQRVYYINLKPIEDNLFGTATPIPFRFVDQNVGIDMDLHLRCRGRFSYVIEDPIIFFTRMAANVNGDYMTAELSERLKSEFMMYLQNALAAVSNKGVRPSQLPGETLALVDAMNIALKDKWLDMRGLKLFSIALESVSVPDDEQKIISDLQKTKVFTNPQMAGANLAQAQADAMRSAASNTHAGPMMAFAGMNMAQNAGGLNANALFQMGGQSGDQPGGQQQQQVSQAQVQPAAWKCTACNQEGNTGRFCMECGAKKPESESWVCECGSKNTGRFCSECGKPRP